MDILAGFFLGVVALFCMVGTIKTNVFLLKIGLSVVAFWLLCVIVVGIGTHRDGDRKT